jgi:hypothetical protein
LPDEARAIGRAATSALWCRKGTLEANYKWTRSQQNAKAENLLKTKDRKRQFLLNKAENILKNKVVNKKAKVKRKPDTLSPAQNACIA